MNIYQTKENPEKNKLLQYSSSKSGAKAFIQEYIKKYIRTIYGTQYYNYFADNENKYVMSLDQWNNVKNTLPCGHYFVGKDDGIGYNIYSIQERFTEIIGYLWNYETPQKYIVKVCCIHAVPDIVENINDKSILGIRDTVPTTKIGDMAKEINRLTKNGDKETMALWTKIAHSSKQILDGIGE